MPGFTKQQKEALADQLETLLRNTIYDVPTNYRASRFSNLMSGPQGDRLVTVHIPGTRCTYRVPHNTYSINHLLKKLGLLKKVQARLEQAA